MTLFNEAVSKIERGRSGLNVGLPMGFEKLKELIPDIQQGTYYLIGAATGCGKTTLADQMFLYEPFDFIKNNKKTKLKLKIHYFSFEIEKSIKIVKGICRKLYTDFNIILPVDYVLSRGKHRMSDEIYQRTMMYREYFEEMEDILSIFDFATNPTGVYKYLVSEMLKQGTVIKKPLLIKNEENPEGLTIEVFDKYVPNDLNLYNIVIVDHVALLREERGWELKKTIDKLSNYLIEFRNNYNVTPVVIQQLNYDINSPDRTKVGRLTPMLSDFGDSKYTTRDANVVLSLFNPSTFDVLNFKGYDVESLGDRFRSLEVLKNRDGALGRTGLCFIGECGYFKEMPKATEMKASHYEAIAKLKMYKEK